MSKVQIDDYECEECGKFGLGELDIKTGKYISMFCDCESKIKREIEIYNQAIDDAVEIMDRKHKETSFEDFGQMINQMGEMEFLNAKSEIEDLKKDEDD